jgi:hypothetical protein
MRKLAITVSGLVIAATTVLTAPAAQAETTSGIHTQATRQSTAPAVAPRISKTKRGLYVSQTGCEIAGEWGWIFGDWNYFECIQEMPPGDDEPWYRLYTWS